MTTLPTETPVTPLDDMAMRSMRSRTQHDYVRHVRAFAAFLRRSPETATAEDVRRFKLHRREHGVEESVIGATVSALRFLFGVTLDRPDLSRKLVLAPRPRKLPDVLSVDEVARLLEATPGINYRAALGVAYGVGLRVSEVAHLKADDIDSKRMLIRIEEGKGRKDRNAILLPQLLELPRLWWREGKRRSVLLPHGWLLPGRTLPAEVADVAYQNKAVVYGLLFQAASETMTTIAADPKHLGARIGITAALHTWGSAMTHHPHIHMIVPGGGLSPDGSRWVLPRPAFLLPVRVLGKLFRHLFLTRLMALYDAGRLGFFGSLAALADRRAFLRHLSPVCQKNWVVYPRYPTRGNATPDSGGSAVARMSGNARPSVSDRNGSADETSSDGSVKRQWNRARPCKARNVRGPSR